MGKYKKHNKNKLLFDLHRPSIPRRIIKLDKNENNNNVMNQIDEKFKYQLNVQFIWLIWLCPSNNTLIRSC